MRSNFELFAIAWLLMWGLAYIATAIFAPWIAGDAADGTFLYAALGCLILVFLALYIMAYNKLGYVFTAIFLGILGILEVYGGIASWTGLMIWNVPFANLEIFQVSMAFADLISAAVFFYLAILQINRINTS